MSVPLDCAPSPCGSCPYRKDVPPGVWSADEYRKLPEYDEGKMQLGIFLCHQTNASGRETVCRGWLTVAAESVAVRLALARKRITLEQRDAPVLVRLYSSGAEACAAGLEGIKLPSAKAKRLVARLIRKGAGR